MGVAEPQSNASALIGMGVAAFVAVALARQVRKPTWWPGRMFARLMNTTHFDLTTWGLEKVAIDARSTILDVGCGGGRTIQRLVARAPEGKVYGADYAAASVAEATKLNAPSIAAGRVEILRASVSSLPFPPDAFDVVTAVETHYYWPDLATDLAEIRRVLRPRGRVVIIAESYRGKRFGAADALAMGLLGGRLLSADGHRDVLVAAGFVDVDVEEERSKGWIRAVGAKT